MVLVEQNRTAPMVAHGCPASRSSRMWARCRTSGSGSRPWGEAEQGVAVNLLHGAILGIGSPRGGGG